MIRERSCLRRLRHARHARRCPQPAAAGAALAERLGVAVTEAQASEAMREEVAYYRGHMHEGVDAQRAAELHARSAEVLRARAGRRARALGPLLDHPGAGDWSTLLLDSLRFRVHTPTRCPRRCERVCARPVYGWWSRATGTPRCRTRVLDRVGLARAARRRRRLGVVRVRQAGIQSPASRAALAAGRCRSVSEAGCTRRRSASARTSARRSQGGNRDRPVLLARDRGLSRRRGRVRPGRATRSPELLDHLISLATITSLAELPSPDRVSEPLACSKLGADGHRTRLTSRRL